MRFYKYLLVCLLLWTSISYGQSYINVGEEKGIQADSDDNFFGVGISFYDFNHDGWDDLTFGRFNDSPKFYQNNQGEFQLIDMGIGDFPNSKSVIWVDIDNDGDSDLFGTNLFGGCRLYENNGDMTFTDLTFTCGMFLDFSNINDSWGACWGDFNKDSYLDVYITNHCSPESGQAPVYNYLYVNNGDGTFTDVSVAAGVQNGLAESFQGVWVDYDYDGWLDLYVINDKWFSPNAMYHNNQDGTFTDVSDELNVGIGIDAMSNSHADIDLDGDLDLYVTNTEFDGNVLLINEGEEYVDDTYNWNAFVNAGCFSANFVDFDNDMYEDCHVSATTKLGYWTFPPNYALHNMNGQIFFVENDIFEDNNYVQYNTAMGDFNNDGKEDLCGVNDDTEYVPLWENTTANNNRWIQVSVEGVVSNRDGVSTWIDVHTGNKKQTRFTFCGEDYVTQDSQREHFGLAGVTLIDSIVVKWLSGHEDRFYDVPVNQALHIVEGSSMDTSISFEVVCEGEETTMSAPDGYDSYMWSNGEETQSITIDSAGVYTVTVYNELGVYNTSDELVYTPISSPSFDSELTPTSCYGGEDGGIQLNSIGSAPLEEIIWSNDSLGLELNNLAAGVYAYEATDINGCVSAGEYEVIQPLELSVIENIQHTSCNALCDGALDIEISGGTGSYTLTGVFDGLCAGEHSVLVHDENDCEIEHLFVIEEPESIVFENTLTDISCFGVCDGEIAVSATNFEIDDTLGDISDLCPGEHVITVNYNNGCTEEVVFEIIEPELLSGDLEVVPADEQSGGAASIVPEGGTPPYEIEWSNGSDEWEVDNLDIDDYWVTITDNNGCELLLEFDIALNLFSYDVEGLSIYPNPVTSILYIDGADNLAPYRILGMDGKTVVQGELEYGHLDLSELPAGVYHFQLYHNQHWTTSQIFKQ